MARPVISDTLTTACPQYASLKATLPPATSVTALERAALTHAAHCPTCGPLADTHRRMQAAQTRRLANEAQAETEQAAVPVLEQAAAVIETNGFHRHFLWDTAQADRGIPLEDCRVDIAGALGIVLYGSPRYAGAPRVRAVEQLLVDRVDAPSLAAWYSRPGIGLRQAVTLLRGTADELRACHTGQPATAETRAA